MYACEREREREWEKERDRDTRVPAPSGCSLLQRHFFFNQKIVLFLLYIYLGPHLQPMDVPRLGVELELQLPAYTTATATATATLDLSHIHDLHHSSWQCRILNPPSEARNQTHVLMDTSWICYR